MNEDEKRGEEFWYQEKGFFSPGYRLNFKVKKLLHKEKSAYQTIEVVDTYTFGKMLLLDGLVMVTDADEHRYHEMLVHPAMVAHPEPQTILVIGGGDGGALREILKYTIKKVVLVEIDQKVIEVSRRYFPELSKSFSDQRVEVVIQDGAKFVKEAKNKFDIIFIDSTDPEGPSAVLVEDEFLSDGASRLNPEGIWVAQSEPPFFCTEFIKTYTERLKKLYKLVKVYLGEIPSYGGGWSFTFASNKVDLSIPKRNPPPGLKYYNLGIHKSCFALPEYLHSILY